MTPRGARSGSVRWWLFSAISLYLRVLRDLEKPEAADEQHEGASHHTLQHGDAQREPAFVFRDCH